MTEIYSGNELWTWLKGYYGVTYFTNHKTFTLFYDIWYVRPQRKAASRCTAGSTCGGHGGNFA